MQTPKLAAAVLLLPVCALLAQELQAEAPPRKAAPELPGFPAQELAAAETAWKMAGASERARRPGPAGQADLFWEILKLLEKEPPAREDRRLLRILEWLVFEVPLQTDRVLSEPLYGRLPAVAPKLGARLLDERLQLWLHQGAASGSGLEPWRWPEVQRLDPAAMRAAVQRLYEAAPKHNPVVKLHLAAALLACGAEKGQECFAEARAECARELPGQARMAVSQLIQSLLSGGVKPALRLCLEQAREEGREQPKERAYQAQETARRLYTALDWNFPGNVQNLDEELKQAAAWLERHEKELEYDSATQRFRAQAAQPGFEEVHRLAKALNERYGTKLMERLSSRGEGLSAVLEELLQCLSRKAEAAQDADAAALVLALAGHPRYQTNNGQELFSLSERLKGIRMDVAAKVWSLAARKQLELFPERGLENILQRAAGQSGELTETGFAEVREDFRRAAEAASKTKDRALFLDKTLSFLLLGGAMPAQEVEALAQNTPPNWTDERGRLLATWNERLLRQGRVAGLVLLLKRAQLLPEAQKGTLAGLLFTFAQQTGWPAPQNREKEYEQVLAAYQAWLAVNYEHLKWDAASNRFRGGKVGAASPPSQIADALIERHGFKTTYKASDWSSSQRFIGVLLEAVQKNPELAKDPEVGLLFEKIAEDPQVQASQALLLCVYRDWPKLNREAGLQLWVKVFSAGMAALINVTRVQHVQLYSSPVIRLLQSGKGFDAGVLQAARVKAEAAVREQFQAPAEKDPALRTHLELACMAFGGPLQPERLKEFIKTARNEHLIGTVQYGEWHSHLLKAGHPGGLAVLLLETREASHLSVQALRRFDQMTGIQAQHEEGISPHKHAPKVQARLQWLSENAAYLEWNAGENVFVLNEKTGGKPFVEKVNAGKPAAPAMTPPKPPEAGPEF